MRLTRTKDNDGGYTSTAKKQELVDALAAYEDTGMTPEEIAELMIAFESSRREAVAGIPAAFDQMAKAYKERLMVTANGSRVETIKSLAAARIIKDFSAYMHQAFADAGLE